MVGRKIKNTPYFLVISLFFVSIFSPLFLSGTASATATQLTNRSLTLQSTSTANGGSTPSAVVDHLFTFTVQNVETIKSVQFQYCTTADVDIGGTCTTPTGLVTTSAVLGSPTGGFTSLVNTTNGAPYVTNSTGVTTTANQSLSVQLTTVTNQNSTNCGGSPNCTFFVSITTYSSTSPNVANELDAGTVAASTSSQIVLTGTMPESLIFCTGGTVNATCTTTTSGSITFNQLFSPTSTAFTTSQMAASTNATNGYAITVGGPTMTSGSNTVTAIGATPAVSTPGTRQFGLNLAANTGVQTGDPNITNSAYVSPASDGVNYFGSATQNFDYGDPSISSGAQQSKFAFNASGLNTVAASDNGANLNYTGNTPGPTNSQVFTVSYIVNVSGNLPAGTYTSTLTYICTATY